MKIDDEDKRFSHVEERKVYLACSSAPFSFFSDFPAEETESFYGFVKEDFAREQIRLVFLVQPIVRVIKFESHLNNFIHSG